MEAKRYLLKAIREAIDNSKNDYTFYTTNERILGDGGYRGFYLRWVDEIISIYNKRDNNKARKLYYMQERVSALYIEFSSDTEYCKDWKREYIRKCICDLLNFLDVEIEKIKGVRL